MEAPFCYICLATNTPIMHSVDMYKSRALKSQKTIIDIIKHISRVIKVNFSVPARARLCTVCYRELIRYDSFIVELLEVQKIITDKIKARVRGISVKHSIKQYNANPSGEFSEHNVLKIERDFNDVKQEDNVGSFGCEFDEDKFAELVVQEDIEHTEEMHFETEVGEDEINEFFSLDKNESKHQCPVCNLKLTNKKALAYHLENDHKSRVTCNMCGAQVRNEEYLALHMNIHNGKLETECSFCDKKFARRANVIRHMEVHFDKKKHQCERCGMFFSQSTVFLNHRLQHEAEDNPQICSICNQSFKTSKTFKRHMITHQDDRPRFNCESCGKVFVDKYTLKVHKKTHHIDEEDKSPKKKLKSDELEQELLTCIICQHIFLGREFFNDHMQNVHDVVLEN